MATKARQLSSVPGTFRNKIINGDFDIWQRGISQTSSGYGSADRWRNNHVGTSKTTTRQKFGLGQTNNPGNPKYYSRTVVNSVAGQANLCVKQQAIEGVDTFSGETVTVSFYARADAVKNIALEFIQDFGSGGSPSSSVLGIGAQKIAITASMAKYTVRIAIPSISGKVLGNAGDNLALTFWFDAGSDFNDRTDYLGQQSGTFDISQVQVEAGPVATEFEKRDIGTELALCQRYYQRFNHPATSKRVATGQSASTTLAYIPVFFLVLMRASGTFSYSSLSDWSVHDGTSAPSLTDFTSGGSSEHFTWLVCTVASGLTVGRACNLRTAAANAWYAVDAEL